MAIDLGGTKQQLRPSMNVTPLVDVVLVLLIIFMVVTPMLTRQLWLDVPPRADAQAAPPVPDAQPPIVLSLRRDGTSAVNGEAIAPADLPARLRRLIAARADKVIFFDAESGVGYGEALELMDRVKGEVSATVAVLAEPLP